jgi:hypothetical protein
MSNNLDTPESTPAKRRGGPQSPEAKARVSKNAIKTGSKVSKKNAAFVPPHSAVLTSEDRQIFISILEDYIRDFNPTTPTALGFIRAAACDQWCLNRLEALNTALYERESHRTAASFLPIFAGSIEMQRLLAAVESAASTEVLCKHLVAMRREYRDSRRENLRLFFQCKAHCRPARQSLQDAAAERAWAEAAAEQCAQQCPEQCAEQCSEQCAEQHAHQCSEQCSEQCPGSQQDRAA